MITTIAKWTLWQRKWSTIWWIVGILAFIVLILAFYPPFRNHSTQLDQAISNQIPQSARAFISDTQNFLTPIGYLSSQIYYLFLPMLLSILAIGLGSSLIAREEKDGTIELLLSRPISRGKLLAGKALAGLIIVILAALASFIATAVLVPVVKLPVGTMNILMATLSCLLMCLSFGSIAFMITMFSRARAASIGIAAMIAIGGYIVSSLSSVATWLKWPAKIMPFHYYRPANILNGHYHAIDFVFFGIIIVVCGIVSWVAFRRRDIG